MGIFAKNKDFFGLDIGTTGVRVVQLAGGGEKKNLIRYGAISIDSKISQSQAPADMQKTAQVVKKLVSESGIKTKSVVIGAPSQQVYSSVIETAQLSPQELGKSIKYLAEQYIPVSLDQVKLDWAQIGPAPNDPKKQEVLLLSAKNTFTEARLSMLESIGLDVVSIQPDALAISRALIPATNNEPTMILDLGANSSDLTIVFNGAPRLIRSIPVGGQTFIHSIMQSLGVDAEQASQFVFKFGLNREKLEGQIFTAVQSSLQTLIEEIKKSAQFFSGRYKGSNISKIIVTGHTSAIPELPVYIVNESKIAVEIGNSWVNVNYPAKTQDQLMSISTQYSVAVGLAEANL